VIHFFLFFLLYTFPIMVLLNLVVKSRMSL
jgi:hypothetical protein